MEMIHYKKWEINDNLSVRYYFKNATFPQYENKYVIKTKKPKNYTIADISDVSEIIKQGYKEIKRDPTKNYAKEIKFGDCWLGEYKITDLYTNEIKYLSKNQIKEFAGLLKCLMYEVYVENFDEALEILAENCIIVEKV